MKARSPRLEPFLSPDKKPWKSPSSQGVSCLRLSFLFLVCFSVYLRTLSPCFLDDDSAETITAGVTLGIQHPPGYPLDALFIRLFSFIPVGGICFRVNLGSALLAACGALLLFFNIHLVLRRFFSSGKSPSGEEVPSQGVLFACAAFSSLCLAFSKTYWEKALGAKGGIYILEMLLLLILLRCAIGYETQRLRDLEEKTGAGPFRPIRWGCLAAFVFGVGLAHYWQTQVLFIPAFLIFFLLPTVSFPKKPLAEKTKACLVLASLGLLGLLPLLFLPLRAHLHPALNLGAPDSLSNFMAALLRKYVAFREPGLTGAFWHVLGGSLSWHQFKGLWNLIVNLQGYEIPVHFREDMKGIGMAFAALGVLAWWRAGERRLLLFLLLPFACLLGALYSHLWMVNNPHLRWYMDNYLLPANWMMALMAGIGLYTTWKWLGKLLNRGNRFHPSFADSLLLVWVLVISFYFISANFDKNGFQERLVRYDYGENLLKSSPRGSVLFAEADEDYFPLYYFQNVEKKRPDVRVIPSFALFETWGVRQVELKHPELGLTASSMAFPDHFARILYSLSQIVRNNRNTRPICFSHFDGAFHRFYAARHLPLLVQPSGILLRLSTASSPPAPALDTGQLRLRHLKESKANIHESLWGIFEVYKKLGIEPETSEKLK